MILSRFGILVVILWVASSCSSPEKRHKAGGELLGKTEAEIHQCAGKPVKALSRSNFNIVIYSLNSGRSEAATGSKPPTCKAALKIQGGIVKEVLLKPKGATISEDFPGCMMLFQGCLNRPPSSNRSIGRRLLDGLLRGLEKVGRNPQIAD